VPLEALGQVRPEEPVPPAAEQVRRRRWRVTGRDLVAGAVFAIAGAMFVAGATASQDGDIRVDTTGGLRDAIATRADHNAELQAQVDALTRQVADLQQQADDAPGLPGIQAQIAGISPMVGLTEVIGPGITVLLDDAEAPDPLPDGMTGDDYIVHQQDVQGVVNALWRGGASGVTVMGQRLISTSAVRCVGNTVILQGRVYSPPFVIEGVGDVARMEAALEADESVRFFREWAEVVGLRYEQTTSRRLVLPAYSGPLSPKYAEVVS
jgi:uncharacterized protein YlxW (UPF0749 family)